MSIALAQRLLLRCFVLSLLLISPVSASAEEIGARSGLGLQVAPLSTGEVVVLAIVPNSPAVGGGIQPGDLIRSINGTPLAGLAFQETAGRFLFNTRMRVYRLVLSRPGVAGDYQVVLERALLTSDPIPLPGVELLPQPLPAGEVSQ